ncbi:MAG: phosphate--nucleotide phosphotransferase [Gammaproteobacteria bacterium]|nr:MAG: phosphate--nucleotide phosphotransferase [Gammaproteobacteria bacterium]
MFDAIKNKFLVPFDGNFSLKKSLTKLEDLSFNKEEYQKNLNALNERIDTDQRMLYAQDKHSVLLVFQAIDAAGKDGTIRAVTRGINPAGCQVFSFKQPSKEELDHDFLWRTTKRMPQRGRIGVFNRSYYEEVLVVRVHPEYLRYQQLPDMADVGQLWQQRYESIRQHERHMAQNGTVILKFWLNVSKQEQKERLLARIDTPEKNWKFSSADVEERQYWDEYMAAYEDALNETSRPWAPWYAIPADDKRVMRLKVAEILAETLEALNLQYPSLAKKQEQELQLMRERLINEK